MSRHAMLLALLAACAPYTPPAVPVSGAAADVAALAGEWHGEYWSDEAGGRSGSLLFRLEAGADSAHGDVLMLVHARERPPGFLADAARAWERAAPEAQVLRITFVRAEAGGVAGLLYPYTDPQCGCTLRTTFSGHVTGNAIDGVYTSRHQESGALTGGRWRAYRRMR